MAVVSDDTCKGAIIVLLESLNDQEDAVNTSVIKSLNKIASVHPNDVVEVFCDFYENSPKLPEKHLANIVKVLEQTCVNGAKNLTAPTAESLVASMLRALTQTTDYVPSVQLGASSVLVAVGHVHYDMVLQALMAEISSVRVPHYTLPHTLGTLAAVNTHATVPHIKDILGKMIPLLPLIKVDAIKQAFSYAFGHFAIAVSEQIGDNVANDITSIKDNFVIEFSVIFDVMFNQWLLSNEPKVTESVLEALGPITRLISEGKFNETVNKLAMTLLSLYRRQNLNAYTVSQCISYLLSPSPLNPKLNLNDNVLNAIINNLFQLVLLEPDYDQPHSVKNHFEVLRCFDHMAEQLPELTIENLLSQCKNNQEKERIKAVIVLTHLTTSSQMFVDKYSAKFVNILKVMITHETSLKMRKVLVKAIVGLVYRNCVANEEDFTMVDFIIKHSSFEGTAAMDKADVDDLQDTCKSSLFLLSNTVTNVRTQLCNLLLKSLVVEDFSGSVTTVTHCLTNLLQETECNEDTTEQSSEKHTPELIFVRCLIFLIDPKHAHRNKNVLMFLECYSDHIHHNLKLSSNMEVQRMLKYVNNNESEEEWHSMLRDLLISVIDHFNTNKWLETVSTLLSQQIISHKFDPPVKGISLQFLAILSCHMTNLAIVEKMLNVVIHAIRTTPITGCPYISKAVGIASRKHGDYVMNELDLMYKDVDNRKGSKIFSFMSSRKGNDAESSVMRIIIIECYGKVAKECIDEHVLARLGENVTTMINDVLKTSPNMALTRVCLTALYEVAKALYPAPHHTIVLRNRWPLLNVVLEQLFNKNVDNKNVELYPIIVKASKALTKLQKGILPEERNTIIRLLLNSLFGELSLLKQVYEKEGKEAEHDFLAKTLNDSLHILHRLIRELVIQSTCLSMIDDLVGLLFEWIHNENDDVRSAACNVLRVVFDTFIKNVKLNYETPSKFGQMGYLLGILVPKTTDTHYAVRLTTMDNIKLVIMIEDLYDGHSIDKNDPCMKSLDCIHNSILTNDLKMITDFSVNLARTISEKIPQQQLLQFTESILESFEDNDFTSTGISAVLNELFKCKGADLYQSIERIVEILLKTMDNTRSDRRFKLLGPLASLAHHHSNAVIAVLLCQRLPLKESVTSCWRHLARDCVLSTAVVDNFLRTMTSIQLFEDPYHITENHIAALQPLTLVTALGEMLEESSMRQLCLDKFPELFSVLYTTLASYAGALPPAHAAPPDARQERFGFVPNRDAVKMSPAKMTLRTFGAFLQQANCQKVKEACTLYSSSEEGTVSWSCPELAPLLAGALCRDGAAQLPRLVASLAPYARSSLPPHRRAAIALFAELLHYRCNDNPVLMDSVLATLVSACADTAGSVRVAALRGLAAVARLAPQYRAGHLACALTTLSHGLDATKGNTTENVPLASMQGLCRLLIDLETIDSSYHRELLSITQKIRPFMNTEEAILREQSIKLFGVIASYVKSDAMIDQSVNMLPCFLLHLCDVDQTVVRASKLTVKRVFSTLSAPRSDTFVQTHLVETGRLHHSEFLTALLRLLAAERPADMARHVQNTLGYLASGQDDMKAHAALILATLYSEMSQTDSDTEIDEEVRRDTHSRLLHLMRSPSRRVREHAAAALASVCLACSPHPGPAGDSGRHAQDGDSELLFPKDNVVTDDDTVKSNDVTVDGDEKVNDRDEVRENENIADVIDTVNELRDEIKESDKVAGLIDTVNEYRDEINESEVAVSNDVAQTRDSKPETDQTKFEDVKDDLEGGSGSDNESECDEY